MKRKSIPIFLVLVLVMLYGCATFTRDAYRSLTVSQQTYDSTMSVIGDLYKEGKVTEDQKKLAVGLGRIYVKAHNGAVTALAKYEEEGGEANKAAYIEASREAARALADLIAFVRPLFEEG